jgi:ubiquinone/menaquinone biosynthesis C-methylase UbiE
VTSRDTSWEKVSGWYGKAVGEEGSYYHRSIILPGSLALLGLKKDSSLLDLACGQGVLARQIPTTVRYVGLDLSPALIKQARNLDKDRQHIYRIADVTADLPVEDTDFSHAAIILSLQNITNQEAVIKNASGHLRPKGRFLIVINHPCFRIPRQSSWGVDPQNKTQYRRIDRYLSPIEVPIQAHPGKGTASETTWTYHQPLSAYSRMLSQTGFLIEKLEEWVSESHSTGGAARMENRARREFPLFLALLARKD